MEKFFEIDKYLQQNHLAIEGFSRDKIDKMVSYVVYMLQPNLEVPTIGASLGRQIGLAGMYKELAASRPDLLYVLTQGAYGEKPSQLNVQYPASGETIMRSGWGQREEYVNQTQLIFDAGNYRTNHSDLDALSFNLFGKGVALLPDAGLYSYEPGPYRSYFHGTRAHNTVVVDGKDQGIGNASTTNKVTAGFFEEGKGYVYQSAESNLYEGVSHERAVALIEDSTMLVIDDLKSVSEHTYEQMFHIFPGAKTSTDGLTVTAQGAVPEQSVVIRQFMTDGVEVHTVLGDQNSPDGLCSLKYNEAVPCESVSYTQKGTDVSYVTAIRIGKDKVDVRFDKENNQMVVTTDKRKYRVKIHKTDGTARRIEANKQFDVEALYSGAQPASALNALSEWKLIERTEPQTDKGSVSFNKKEKSLEMVTPVDGSLLSVGKDTDVDLSDKDLYFKIKVNQSTNLKGIDISLSNNHWEKEARYNIDEVFNYSYANREGEWLQFGAGKSYFRKANLGGWWTKVGSHFDWSKIDSIRIIARSEQGKRSVIDVKDFVLVPNQEQARAVIVFDDGWASVMDAVPSMKVYGVKGNVGVITGSVGKRSYLTLDELKTLQNEYGWDIANHSSLHKNAVNEYEKNNNMQGLESDVSDALEYLIQNDINSAPNWYVYPDGSTDGAVKGVIGKYYKFGRSTSSVITHSFPFAEPLEVGVFPVYSDRTTPAEVHDAISDAIKYDQTIFLMFHKISQGAPSMFTEISVKDFDTIVKDIHQQGIQVVTLSELDAENNVPETVFALHDATSGQLKLDVSLDRASGIFSHGILQTWEYLADLKKNIVQSLPF